MKIKPYVFVSLFFIYAMIPLLMGASNIGGGGCGTQTSDTTPAPAPTPVPTPTPDASYPKTCKEVQSAAVAETGNRPSDGTYTLYVNGDKNSPWEAFCFRMNLESPTEYLTVSQSDNYSQIGNGTYVSFTSYRRYRIDPSSLEINPLDARFATNSGFDVFMPDLPAGLTSIPAGWAEFQPHRSDDGPAAVAYASLTGTPFVFSESILSNNLSDFFCTVSDPSTPPSDTTGSGAQVSADLSTFALFAINSNQANQPTGVWTREVADCADLGPTSNFTTASCPLQYVAQ